MGEYRRDHTTTTTKQTLGGGGSGGYMPSCRPNFLPSEGRRLLFLLLLVGWFDHVCFAMLVWETPWLSFGRNGQPTGGYSICFTNIYKKGEQSKNGGNIFCHAFLWTGLLLLCLRKPELAVAVVDRELRVSDIFPCRLMAHPLG